MRKYWREAYLIVMMALSLSILVASAVNLTGLMGLVMTAAGVFIGVLAIGMYDTWYKWLAR